MLQHTYLTNEVMDIDTLERAIIFKRYEIIYHLLDRGIIPNNDVLYTAVEKNMTIDIIKKLINHSDTIPDGLLHHAIKFNVSTDIIKELLNHGISPNLKNENGILPLDVALYNNMPECTQILRKHDAQKSVNGLSFLRQREQKKRYCPILFYE